MGYPASPLSRRNSPQYCEHCRSAFLRQMPQKYCSRVCSGLAKSSRFDAEYIKSRRQAWAREYMRNARDGGRWDFNKHNQKANRKRHYGEWSDAFGMLMELDAAIVEKVPDSAERKKMRREVNQ